MDRTLNVLKQKDKLRPGDQAWVDIDRDQWSSEILEEVWNWAAERADRGLALSNPQFELWLLWHFDDAAGTSTPNEILRNLNKHIPGYRKDQSNQLPREPDAIAQAINCAERKIPHMPESFAELEEFPKPWTTVHILVRLITEAIKRSSAQP